MHTLNVKQKHMRLQMIRHYDCIGARVSLVSVVLERKRLEICANKRRINNV